MGGLATQDISRLCDYHDQVLISPAGAIQLARHDIPINISSESISDKSKANLLGRGLVCLQTLWFITQCISRHVAGYPLTLLELHTSVHVVCAIIMYILWWKVSWSIIKL